MADTLSNIPIPKNQWADVYTLSGIVVGTAIAIENIGVSDLYATVRATQPAIGFNAYNLIRREGPQYRNDTGASGAWVFSPSIDGKINVRVLS